MKSIKTSAAFIFYRVFIVTTDLCPVNDREASIWILFLEFQVWITLAQEVLNHGVSESDQASSNCQRIMRSYLLVQTDC